MKICGKVIEQCKVRVEGFEYATLTTCGRPKPSITSLSTPKWDVERHFTFLFQIQSHLQWRLFYALRCFGNLGLRRQHVMLSGDRPHKHTLYPSPIPLAFAPNPLRAAPYLIDLIYREVYRQICSELRPFMPVAEDPFSLQALVSAIDYAS